MESQCSLYKALFHAAYSSLTTYLNIPRSKRETPEIPYSSSPNIGIAQEQTAFLHFLIRCITLFILPKMSSILFFLNIRILFTPTSEVFHYAQLLLVL